MNSKSISNGILRALLIIVGVTLLLFFLWKIQSVIVYIIIAGVLSLIGRPLIIFLKRKLKFPDTLAVIITMSLFLGFIFGLIRLFIPLITQQGKNLSLLNINKLTTNAESIISQVNEYFLLKNINILEQVKSLDLLSNFKEIPNLLNSIIGTVGSISIGLFSVLFISFFLMKDGEILNKGLMVLVPDNTEKRFQKSFTTIKDLLSRYFIGLVTQITILFILYSIVLAIFGVQNAIVIAFLCALLNLIPYVGPMIGAVLILLLK
jgi:predicted PurR-regulated permease PerM